MPAKLIKYTEFQIIMKSCSNAIKFWACLGNCFFAFLWSLENFSKYAHRAGEIFMKCTKFVIYRHEWLLVAHNSTLEKNNYASNLKHRQMNHYAKTQIHVLYSKKFINNDKKIVYTSTFRPPSEVFVRRMKTIISSSGSWHSGDSLCRENICRRRLLGSWRNIMYHVPWNHARLSEAFLVHPKDKDRNVSIKFHAPIVIRHM